MMNSLPFEIPKNSQVYRTRNGTQISADSLEVLRILPSESIDLIVTSPPFALLRQKKYGNEKQDDYVQWLSAFGKEAIRVLKPKGSFVLDIGGAYQRNRPVRSLYNFRVLLDFCDNIGYRLAQEFFWYNPSKLPSPIEWVNKRKIRVKDAVNTVWWFSKTDYPKADVTKVLTPYSARMKTLLRNPEKFYKPKERPSGHDISKGFDKDNNGAIPPNLLQISNADSNSHYLRTCKNLEKPAHPARFPQALPDFFIRFLTDPEDIVLDIFSGSNTTGYAAEQLGRRWIGIEANIAYAVLSAVRFMDGWELSQIRESLIAIEQGNVPLIDNRVPPNRLVHESQSSEVRITSAKLEDFCR
ncbi:MAG: Modification methylase MjaV [Methanosaeta sp. PtaU1.Bin112]|nr:MAG: Modification methylase MjaV [Methanosaeta sp. PtaU1.Bin112]